MKSRWWRELTEPGSTESRLERAVCFAEQKDVNYSYLQSLGIPRVSESFIRMKTDKALVSREQRDKETPAQ